MRVVEAGPRACQPRDPGALTPARIYQIYCLFRDHRACAQSFAQTGPKNKNNAKLKTINFNLLILFYLLIIQITILQINKVPLEKKTQYH